MSPGIVLNQRPSVHVNDGMGGVVQTEPNRWAAENTPTGIFLTAGPSIEPLGNLGEIDIRDITPTILAAHGIDIPLDMDGEVINIFESKVEVGQQDPIDTKDNQGTRDDEEVANRLKQLGYME